MYNCLAWIFGHLWRRCDNCGTHRCKHQMFHPFWGSWYCDQACEAEEYEARVW